MSTKALISGALGVMGLANIVYAIFINPDTGNRIFSFEVSKTVYLAFWSILTVLMFKDFFKHLKNKNPKN